MKPIGLDKINQALKPLNLNFKVAQYGYNAAQSVITFDPINLGWKPNREYIADFKRQYGYEPDSSDMYYDYDYQLLDDFIKSVKQSLSEFKVIDYEVSTEYRYVDVIVEYVGSVSKKPIKTQSKMTVTLMSPFDKLFPDIIVKAYNADKYYEKVIDERPNMVGEDVRDLLKKTFVNFMDTADIFYCCTLNDHNYLGYHTKTGIDLDFDEVFEKFKNQSEFEHLLNVLDTIIPYDTFVIYNSTEYADGLIIKFTQDQLAINNKVAESTIQEIKTYLEGYSELIRYSIQPKADFIDRAGNVGPQYFQIVIHPRIEKFIKF